MKEKKKDHDDGREEKQQKEDQEKEKEKMEGRGETDLSRVDDFATLHWRVHSVGICTSTDSKALRNMKYRNIE